MYDQNFQIQTQTLTPASNTFPLLKSEDNWTYEAQMKKLYKVNFASDKGNQIYVNGNPYNTPTPVFDVVEQNKILASALEFEENNIRFFVSHWDYGTLVGGTIEWTPNSNLTNTVHYKGMPLPYDRNLHFNSYNPRFPNTNVKLYWNQYPNSNVNYQIWRKVYQNYTLVETRQLTTLSNSVTTYTDIDYFIQPSGNGDFNLSYDVRPVYVPSGIAQYENYIGFLDADGNAVEKSTNYTTANQITEYSLSNYPNPFNPKTRIQYQLPQTGHVTVKVYNALGKEVATLVNAERAEGSYTVEFDGSNLSSGMYFCEMRSRDYTSIKKMLMIK